MKWLYRNPRILFPNSSVSLSSNGIALWLRRSMVYFLIIFSTRPGHVSCPWRANCSISLCILHSRLVEDNFFILIQSLRTLFCCCMWSGNRLISPKTAAVGVLWLTPRIFFRNFKCTRSRSSIGIPGHQMSFAYSWIGRIWVINTFR